MMTTYDDNSDGDGDDSGDDGGDDDEEDHDGLTSLLSPGSNALLLKDLAIS